MRPGLLCPGRQGADGRHLFRRGGFNEAGAFMPRKAAVAKASTTAAAVLQ